MWQIIIGSFTLSCIHALIPSHWVPLVAISKTENWTNKRTLFYTTLVVSAHLASTVLIGIIVGYAGIKISEIYTHFFHVAAPLILIALGIFYIITNFMSKHHHHFKTTANNKSVFAILASLSLGMFLSPCLELGFYYLQAAKFGVMGIFTVSLVYLLITIPCVILLVYLGLIGINRFKSKLMENHAKLITGITLAILGLIAYFTESVHIH